MLSRDKVEVNIKEVLLNWLQGTNKGVQVKAKVDVVELCWALSVVDHEARIVEAPCVRFIILCGEYFGGNGSGGAIFGK